MIHCLFGCNIELNLLWADEEPPKDMGVFDNRLDSGRDEDAIQRPRVRCGRGQDAGYLWSKVLGRSLGLVVKISSPAYLLARCRI